MARTETPDETAARATFKRTLEPLLAADGRKFDVLEWTVFFEALRDIPPQLLQRAVIAMARERRQYRFRPGDIAAAAEQQRQKFLADHPHELCEVCRDSKGWITVRDEARGVDRLAKCGCFRAYRESLSAIGITERPVALLTEAVDEAEVG